MDYEAIRERSQTCFDLRESAWIEFYLKRDCRRQRRTSRGQNAELHSDKKRFFHAMTSKVIAFPYEEKM